MATPVVHGGRPPIPRSPGGEVTPGGGASGGEVAGGGASGGLARLLDPERLRRLTGTAPGRLRAAMTVLTVLVLFFGALTAWQVSVRARAAGQVVTHGQPLSQDAAEVYRSLADADTTAAAVFLLASDAPPELRARYEKDLATAAELLTRAAARTGTGAGSGDPTQQWVAELNRQLPVYAGLVETARANDRQGLPLGGAYLRYASKQMQTELLPVAQKLVEAENRRLDDGYDDARAIPWAGAVVGLLVLAALVWCQVQLLRRTNRVFNPGLLAATAAVLAALVWLTGGTTLAQAHLSESQGSGAAPLRVLNQARIEALQARAAENLDLVSRGGSDGYDKDWARYTAALAGSPTGDGKSRTAGQGTLSRALADAPREASATIQEAVRQFGLWDDLHRKSESGDDYGTSLRIVVGGGGGGGAESSAAVFAELDRKLGSAAAAEQTAFDRAARGVDGDLAALAWGLGVLTLLAAAGVVVGLGRRLAEYR
ncbi:hypothetical protein ACIA8O_32690 [Kitasatospora sp. NPDC051853]|uniref:hypothetical protein n=1 Tax=Kitasatospora sp. NPDC051853 TaxID=3364058 RepID=UPI0037949338